MNQSVFKPRRRVAGKVVVSKVWHGCYSVDKYGEEIRVSLHTTDKQVAKEMLRQIVLEKQKEALGMILPESLRKAGQSAIQTHLNDYLRDLESLRRDGEYTYIINLRVSKLCSECKWVLVKDITADSFLAWRSANSGKAAKTLNEYLDAIRGLLNWMREKDRIPVCPLKTVKKVDGRGKDRRVRRALSFEEMQNLLAVCGPRKVVYLAAACTGLRRAELGALQWCDVRLDAPAPYLVVRAATAKNRKEQPMPLHADLVAELRALAPALAGGGAEIVFKRVPSMEVFRSDLKKAGITFLDDRGRRADFHALRHTLGTNLGLAGIACRVAQEVMRHSDPKLTNKQYMDVAQLPTAAAINMLPSFNKAPLGHHTKKYTTTPDFFVHSPSSPVTHGNLVEAYETIANKGGSHGLALAVTSCHNEESGAPARTRT